MPIFLGFLCALASLVLVVAAALMNYRFMTRLGGSELDGQVLGIASVTIDVMLAVIGPLVVWGFVEGRRLYAWSLVGIAAIFAALSFASALGFAAEGRDAMAAGRETERLAVEAGERKLSRLEAARKEVGKARPLAVVEVGIETLRGDRRWLISRECTAARRETTDWCTSVHRLNEERARAREAARLDGEIARANSELLSLRAKSGRTTLDSQVELISELTGWPAAKVRVAIVLLVASAMQLGAGFGLAIGLAPLMVYLHERKQQRVKKPRLGEHLTWGNVGEGAEKEGGEQKAPDSKRAERKNKRPNGRESRDSGTDRKVPEE